MGRYLKHLHFLKKLNCYNIFKADIYNLEAMIHLLTSPQSIKDEDIITELLKINQA